MRVVTIRTEDGTAAARVEGDQAVRLPYSDVGELLASGDDWRTRAAADHGRSFALAGVDLGPVVPHPSKIVCVGLNYMKHVREGGGEVPSYPTLFAKFPDALAGPRDDIVIPSASQATDWEAELVVIIGATVRGADPETAAAAIAGFTIGNDVSMRDWQLRTDQWLQGKTWDAASPVGPALVTVDEVGSPRPDLAISCRVDGEVMQDARTSDLLFDPVDIVVYVSTVVTLRPGDLIFTGTPEGIGGAMVPPRYLQDGEVVTTRIEGLGEQVNRFVAE